MTADMTAPAVGGRVAVLWPVGLAAASLFSQKKQHIRIQSYIRQNVNYYEKQYLLKIIIQTHDRGKLTS